MAPQVETYLEVASQLKEELGDFMVGFDLGRFQLLDLIILELKSHMTS